MGPHHVESRLSRKLRIAVLSGGPSAERLISLKSGSAVARALAGHGETERFGMAGKILQVDLGMAARGRNHPVNQIS